MWQETPARVAFAVAILLSQPRCGQIAPVPMTAISPGRARDSVCLNRELLEPPTTCFGRIKCDFHPDDLGHDKAGSSLLETGFVSAVPGIVQGGSQALDRQGAPTAV